MADNPTREPSTMPPSSFTSPSSDGGLPRKPQPLQSRSPFIRRAAGRGALIGLAAGLAALTGVLLVVRQCLPFYIAYPPSPWPWYCTQPVYGVIGFLAFPVNLLTDDLAQAVVLAPLSLMMYLLAGAVIGGGIGWLGSSGRRGHNRG